ncbi:MAG: protein O-mannosyl-transferase family [Acidobacteriota bacterium]
MRTRWTAGLAAGAVAGLVYLRTLAPTITWRNSGADSGDLATAAFTLGIPHPPGYPLYTLLAAAFAHLPFGEPARNVGLFSALAATGAVVMFYRAIMVLLSAGGRTGWQHEIIAASITLTLAFSPLFWSQATIAEVYALEALLVAALLTTLLSDIGPRLEIAAALFGLGFAHHYSIALLVPTALLLLSDSRLTRQRIMSASLLFLAPLFLYAYLPIRAATDPPVNWGDPRTPDRLWWVLTAEPYRPYLLGLSSGDIVERMATTARFLFEQFNIWGVVLGLWGVAGMMVGESRRARRQALALLTGLGFYIVYAILYGTRDSYIYLIPGFMLFALLIAFGIDEIAQRLSAGWPRVALAGALVLLPFYNLAANFQSMDLSRDRQGFDYAAQVFREVPEDAVVFAKGDERVFALWYYRFVIAGSSSRVVVVSPELLQFDWYYDEIKGRLDLEASGSRYDVRVKEIVDQSLRHRRTVYSTTRDAPFQKYVMESQGELYRIWSPPNE